MKKIAVLMDRELDIVMAFESVEDAYAINDTLDGSYQVREVAFVKEEKQSQ